MPYQWNSCDLSRWFNRLSSFSCASRHSHHRAGYCKLEYNCSITTNYWCRLLLRRGWIKAHWIGFWCLDDRNSSALYHADSFSMKNCRSLLQFWVHSVRGTLIHGKDSDMYTWGDVGHFTAVLTDIMLKWLLQQFQALNWRVFISSEEVNCNCQCGDFVGVLETWLIEGFIHQILVNAHHHQSKCCVEQDGTDNYVDHWLWMK